MFTPQQLEQITFKTAVFGGYDMDSVDETVMALIEDYNTLYKDNAPLKSKMLRSDGEAGGVPRRRKQRQGVSAHSPADL